MSNPNFNPATFRYTPQIVSRTDASGIRRQVTIRFNNSQGQYVAVVADIETIGQCHIAKGIGSSDYAAADAAIANFNRRYL